MDARLLTDFQRWEKLREADQKEEEVEEKFELVEQDDRDEGQHVILHIDDLIAWKASRIRPAIHLDSPFLK
jgi:type II secretory pathway component PulJ